MSEVASTNLQHQVDSVINQRGKHPGNIKQDNEECYNTEVKPIIKANEKPYNPLGDVLDYPVDECLLPEQPKIEPENCEVDAKPKHIPPYTLSNCISFKFSGSRKRLDIINQVRKLEVGSRYYVKQLDAKGFIDCGKM
jgi:hypothetical protein